MLASGSRRTRGYWRVRNIRPASTGLEICAAMIRIKLTRAATLSAALIGLLMAPAAAEGSRSTGPPPPWGFYPNEKGRPPPSGLAQQEIRPPATSPAGRAGLRTQQSPSGASSWERANGRKTLRCRCPRRCDEGPKPAAERTIAEVDELISFQSCARRRRTRTGSAPPRQMNTGSPRRRLVTAPGNPSAPSRQPPRPFLDGRVMIRKRLRFCWDVDRK